MSKKQTKERINQYADISQRSNVKMFGFQILYDEAEKMYLIYLKYNITEKKDEKDVTTEYEELEAYDGKGWLKISNDFTKKDFQIVFDEAINVTNKFKMAKKVRLSAVK